MYKTIPSIVSNYDIHGLSFLSLKSLLLLLEDILLQLFNQMHISYISSHFAPQVFSSLLP